MADLSDRQETSETQAAAVDPALPAGPGAVPTPASTTSPQLSQRIVPLTADLGAELLRSDEQGHLPLVLMIGRAQFIRPEIAVIALALLATGILQPFGLALLVALIAGAAATALVGAWRSLIVVIPEGAFGLATRRGRFLPALGPGTRFLRPGVVLNRVVSARDVPFDAPVGRAPTADGVRVDVDVLITFRVVDPVRFTTRIAPTDFDTILQGACQEGVRALLRATDSVRVLDLVGTDAQPLRERIDATLGTFGVEIGTVVLTYVQPPLEFLASREARGLATIRVAEAEEQAALETRRQADRDGLATQEVTARLERQEVKFALKLQRARAQAQLVELEAAAERLRLQHLEERITAFPAAAKYDWESVQLDVTRALAANSRAVVRMGSGTADLVETLSMDEDGGAAPPRTVADGPGVG